MRVNMLPSGLEPDGFNGTSWIFTPETQAEFDALDVLARQSVPTIQACERCGAYDVGMEHWPCSRPAVKDARAAWEAAANKRA